MRWRLDCGASRTAYLRRRVFPGPCEPRLPFDFDLRFFWFFSLALRRRALRWRPTIARLKSEIERTAIDVDANHGNGTGSPRR